MTRPVQITDIRIDCGTQTRAATSSETVDAYAEAMSEGAKFPPIELVSDGSSLYLVDGFHRFLAAQRLDWRTIDANVTPGTLRDAILRAAGANDRHGLPRSAADKRHSVATLLSDDTWRQRTDSWIADQCHVHQTSVSRIRAEMFGNGQDSLRTRPDGTTVNIAGRGRKKSSSKMPVAEAVALPEPKSETEEILTDTSALDSIPAPAKVNAATSDGSNYNAVISSVMSWPSDKLSSLVTLIQNLLRSRQ